MISKIFHGAKQSLSLLYFYIISLYFFTERSEVYFYFISLYYFTKLPAAAGISTLFQSYFYMAIYPLPKNQFQCRKSQHKSQEVGQEFGAPFFGSEIGAQCTSGHGKREYHPQLGAQLYLKYRST